MATVSIPGLMFPEGPRWRDGTWWLSDQLGDKVLRVSPEGTYQVVCELPRPSGLGFLPDGSLAVALMDDPSVVRVGDGVVSEIADLRSLTHHLNDMFVDDFGRAYCDAYGDHFDRSTHRLVLAAPGAAPRVVADDIAYPNGLSITPDGSTLLLSETFGRKITAFTVEGDGSLSGRRVWAGFDEGVTPDGFCLDAQGDAWIASYLAGEFLHVREGGEILERIEVPGRWALSCSLGGEDGRTLLLCTAETSQDDYMAGRAVGHLETHRVEVPGVGRP